MDKIRRCLNTRGCNKVLKDDSSPFCSEECKRKYLGYYSGYCPKCGNKLQKDRASIKGLKRYFCSDKCYKLAVIDIL
jgi:endogenous inhibitor of DNA gyrase (YacG/DUF329 family)